VEKGVKKGELEKKEKYPIDITINGQKDPKNEAISRKTISLLKKEFSLKLNYN